MNSLTFPLHKIGIKDVDSVGGKNASLGEMIDHLTQEGIRVPGGFAISADAYSEFLNANKLARPLAEALSKLDSADLNNLASVGSACRKLIMDGTLPDHVRQAIHTAYNDLSGNNKDGVSVAVRSSATAEDSRSASFAGQHDSYLNISGFDNLLRAVQLCYASLFNDRAIKYRIDNHFDHLRVKQAVGVQLMVRSDKGSAGVAFTIEPETGNNNLIYITGAWGLGESVVQGAVNTDEFYFFKPAAISHKTGLIYKRLGSKQQMLIYGSSAGKSTQWQETPHHLCDQFVLSDEEVNKLGAWCRQIEKHYEMPMDIEWAKDGVTGDLFIVQARPETVHAGKKKPTLKEYTLLSKATPILKGKAVGRSILSGKVCIVKSLADSGKVKDGDIIVADITNPDWNALLRRAICIVTNKGGRTSHASIVARELGIPAVVGTLNATEKLKDDQIITVSCAAGDEGLIYDQKQDWNVTEVEVESLLSTHTKPMFILADPQKALLYASYPSDGVGLLRMEFIINNTLQVHPMALVNFEQLPAGPEKDQIEALTRHYKNKKQFFIDKLAGSLALVAAAFYPREVIVRLSDFKTNEYAKLLGGKLFEPEEENPMLGFRGASRYYDERYREGFGLECAAIKKVREEMYLENVKVMVPFCRTVKEGRKVLDMMKSFGLARGERGLEVYVMAEIPSNILLADQFAELFDGFSIGSNDLTQLTLGLDRDSAIVSHLFDESNDAVTALIQQLIDTAHRHGIKVGLCGQAPSDHPEFTRFLVDCGIDSISFNADAILKGIENILRAEKRTLSEVVH